MKIPGFIKNRGSNRKIARFYHARNKAKIRYNIDLTKKLNKHFIKLIQQNKTEKAYKQSNTKTIHTVQYMNKKYNIVYDRKEKSIITFLPQGN